MSSKVKPGLEGVMRSELIRGTARSELDAKIMAFIAKHPGAATPHVNIRVAIMNEFSEVYRLIIADGVIELIRADKFLESIGCTEEVTYEFDMLFRVPPRVNIR